MRIYLGRDNKPVMKMQLFSSIALLSDDVSDHVNKLSIDVAVSRGYDTCFGKGLVMGYADC